MDMDAHKLERVRKIFGVPTDTQAVDRALEMVLANEEISQAIDEAFGAVPDFSAK